MAFVNILIFTLFLIHISETFYSNRWLLKANIDESDAKSLADNNGFTYITKVSTYHAFFNVVFAFHLKELHVHRFTRMVKLNIIIC